ncbi:MAG TPA: adenylosuccinate synthetase, partial [candidate division Zixibacteria bacterium]|nr:adenylosuccinate synthetase [candidate division Zixibacteria bacterium]
NGTDKLAIMKLDVLDSFPEIKICTAYEYKGKKTEELPLDLCELSECKPIYKTYPGWKTSTRGITRLAKLPVKARKYLSAIEKALGVPISLISTGPEREATIVKR